MFFKKKKKEVIFAGSQLGAYASRNMATASSEAQIGMDLFLKEAERLVNVKEGIKQGNLFEFIESAKFNVDAATKSSNLRSFVTAGGGETTAPADILIKKGEEVVKEVQAKSSEKSINAVKGFFSKRTKYQGMDKLTNSDNYDHAKELIDKRASSNSIYSDDYKEISSTLKGKLEYEDVQSSGTSYDETIEATRNSEKYATQFEGKIFKKEIIATGIKAGIAGAVIGGGMSAIRNTYKYNKGEINGNEATKEVLKDTAKSGGKAAVVGSTGSVIRIGAQKAGMKTLAKSNVATAVAAGTIECGVHLWKMIDGEITPEEAMEKIGENGVSTVSSIYTGAAAGMVFGPVGAVVGSIGGYLLASNVYQSALSLKKNLELKEQQVDLLEDFCKEACAKMRSERNQFERAINTQLSARKGIYDNFLNYMDNYSKNKDFKSSLKLISDFAIVLGIDLKLIDFDDFDEHMKSGGTLEL